MTTRTARSTAVRDLLREHGVTLSLGTRPVLTQLPRLLEDAELPLPVHLRTALGLVDAELRERETRIQTVEQQLTTFAAHDAGTQRLLRGAGGRALDRHRARGERRAHPRVPAGPAVCELAGAHAPGTLQWHPAAPGRDHQTGPPVSTLPPDARGAQRGARRPPPAAHRHRVHTPPPVGRHHGPRPLRVAK